MSNFVNNVNLSSILSRIKSWAEKTFALVGHTHSQYLTSHQDISGKENISNKVTSISSSSTDTQYPSAKAVVNYINNSGSGGTYPGCDYPVERGSDGNWYYEKWNSGHCEIYGEFSKTLALTTSSANAYTTSGNQTELLPFSLVSGVAVGNAVDKYTEAVTCHVEGQNLIWRPFRHQSSSSASRTYAFIIKGRWK